MAGEDRGMMVLTCGCEVTITAPAKIARACEQHGRLSLRDHFAGQALSSILTSPFQLGSEAGNSPEKAAAWAYEFADAMMAERDEP